MNTPILSEHLIAACGMNCGICRAYLRPKNPCRGCRKAEQNRPRTREHCRLRVCKKRTGRFCFSCADFPCERLKHLDKRYRTRYGMSEIENLEYVRDRGLRAFMKRETTRWVSDQGVFCVHDRQYYKRASTRHGGRRHGAVPGKGAKR